MKNKKTVLALVLLLVIGFASVSTTLVLNGVIGISNKKDDFKVIFTNAKLDNIERQEFIDSETKQTLTYETNKLTTLNETTVLEYEVTNTSRIYDAEVSITCNIVDDAGNTTTSEYVSMEYTPNNMIVEAGKTKTGSITTKLTKVSTEDRSIKVKCTLNANATERESLGSEYVEEEKVGGTIMPLTLNEDTGKITSGKIWDSNITPYITKVIFEKELNSHETTDDLIFDISEAQDGSVMAYLIETSRNTENVKKYDLYIQSDGKIMANANSNCLFYRFESLKAIEGLENLDTRNVTDMSFMFCECYSLTTLNLSNFDTRNVTNMYGMFAVCSSLTTLGLSNFDTSNVTNMSYMFNYCDSLTTLDISNFDTSNVTNMSYMFNYCDSLTTLDISNLDTSKVTNMEGMFATCSSLTTLNLSSFNTSNVRSMSDMFYECYSLTTLDLKNFDTSNVTDMSYMFAVCSSLTTLNLSNFDTSNVTIMSYMFAVCSSLTTLDISNFDTSKVTNMEGMFATCSSLTTLNLSSFNTSNVRSMSSMFSGCESLTTLDISNFVTRNEIDKRYMFDLMPSNATVKVKDATVQNWVLTSDNSRPTEWSTENVIIA